MSSSNDDKEGLLLTDATRTYTGAQYLCEALAQAGVTHVFGGHGGAVVPLIDAIVAHPDLTWVYVRCETNASQAAAAYAKLHGRLGCCIATSGPGASHLLSGLIDADQDRVPILCITGMKDSGHTRVSDFQDIDQSAIFRMAGLALSETVANIDQLLPLTRNAFTAAIAANRCAHLAVPIDVQMKDIAAHPKGFSLGTAFQSMTCHPASDLQVETLANALREQIEVDSRVIIAVGYRARGIGALIERFAELLRAPILTSYDGKGNVDEKHPLAFGVAGVYGNAGTSAAVDLLDQCHTVIGFCVNEWTELILDKSGLQVRKFVQIDERLIAGDGMRFDPVATYVCGFLFRSLLRVLDVLEERLLSHPAHRDRVAVSAIRSTTQHTRLNRRVNVQAPRNTISQQNTVNGVWEIVQSGSFSKPIGTPSTPSVTDEARYDKEHCHPAVFFNVMSEHLDKDSVICADIGDNALFMAGSLIAKRGQRFLTSEHLGIMGYSINSGLAATVSLERNGGTPSKTLVVAGDGGVQMSINELATFKDHNASNVLVAIVVNKRLGRVNNETWGLGLNADGCGIGSPSFVDLFKAYGYPGGMVLSTSDEQVVASTIEKGWQSAKEHGCCVIEVHQDPNTCPVMHKLRYRQSLHSKPYTRIRTAETMLPELDVDHWKDDKPRISTWLDSLSEVKHSDPYWLNKGDLLQVSVSQVVQDLLPTIFPDGQETPVMFPTPEAKETFDRQYNAQIMTALPAKTLLEEVVSYGKSNSHPLKLQLFAIPPGYTFKLRVNPAVKLGIPMVGMVGERYLGGVTVKPSVLARSSALSTSEKDEELWEAPSVDDIAQLKKSIETVLDEKMCTLGSAGKFVDRMDGEGRVIYSTVGSIQQPYTKDHGSLVLFLWCGFYAEIDAGCAIGTEGHEGVVAV